MKKYAVLLHILFWISVPFILAFIAWAYQFTNLHARSYLTFLYDTSLLSLVVVLTGAGAFYLTASGLKPLMKVLLLLIAPGLLVLLLSSVSLAVYWFFQNFLLSAYLTVIPFALAGMWLKAKNELLALEKVNFAAQLELVRSKTNPHFLFNTINNIDALISLDPEQASRYLNKLSALLRFSLYESSADKIPLATEVNYIMEYINLEKIRSVNPEFIRFNLQGNMNGHQIAPMIFIPILENAFKHAGNKTTRDAIVLELDIQEQEIRFTCRNIYNGNAAAKTENGGLGMGLIAQRLNLLYGNRYQMEINKGEYYEVKLKLRLHAD